MIASVAAAAFPLVLAALGGLISERAGALNISLEGCIGAGAFLAVLLAIAGVPPAAAMAASALFGGFCGFVLAAVHLKLGANLFIAGLGLNLLLPALADLVSQLVLGHKGAVRIPEAAPGGWESAEPAVVAAAAPLLALLAAVALSRSAFGRRLKAAGSSPEFLSERGLDPRRTKALALAISSAAAALAGAAVSYRIGAYVPGVSAGRGWIALVVVWMGFRRPPGVLLAAYFFAFMEIIAGRAQGIQSISATLFLALPYLAALVALIIAGLGNRGTSTRK